MKQIIILFLFSKPIIHHIKRVLIFFNNKTAQLVVCIKCVKGLVKRQPTSHKTLTNITYIKNLNIYIRHTSAVVLSQMSHVPSTLATTRCLLTCLTPLTRRRSLVQ